MAYRRRSTSTRRRSSGNYSRGRSYAPRRAPRRRAASRSGRGQTVRLVIEQAPARNVTQPFQVPAAIPRKARF